MSSIDELLDRIKQIRRGPADVVGVDIGPTSTVAVRARRKDDEFTLVAADILPSVSLPRPPPPPREGEEPVPVDVPMLDLPSHLRAKYAALAVTGGDAVVKLLSFPGAFDNAAEAKVVDSLGLEQPDQYRISYSLVTEGRGKSESRVLGVALPEGHAAMLPGLFATGLPAPFSIEVSGLAAMTAFLHGPGTQHSGEAVGVVNMEHDVTTFALFHNGVPVLIRRFNVATQTVLDKVQDMLGVDHETAQNIIADGSFDISQAVGEAIEPVVKQLMVSRDFVERRENCRVAKLYVSGELTSSRDLMDEIGGAVGTEVGTWNPLDGFTVADGALPDSLEGQEWRLGAAAGACLGVFEET
jgi:Tfp pilus assembly PilM family ATPase